MSTNKKIEDIIYKAVVLPVSNEEKKEYVIEAIKESNLDISEIYQDVIDELDIDSLIHEVLDEINFDVEIDFNDVSVERKVETDELGVTTLRVNIKNKWLCKIMPTLCRRPKK